MHKARALVLVASALVVVTSTTRARAVQFHVESRLIGDAYQLITSDDELLNRRRPHIYLGLGLYDLLGDGEYKLNIVTLMRFDSDLGADEAEESKRLYSLDQHRFSIQTAYAEGRDLWDFLDFRLGRFLHSDELDFTVLDGLRMTFTTPWYFGVEVIAGLEAHNDGNPVTNTQLQLDGARYVAEGQCAEVDAGPFCSEGQDTEYTVALGAALVTRNLRWTRARLSYRRLFSDSGIDSEKLGLSFYQRFEGLVHLSFDGSYDFHANAVDRITALLRARFSDAWEADLQYVRLLPIFDSDSIFSIFAAHPLNDLNARLRWHVDSRQRVVLGGTVRFFGNDEHRLSGGGSVDELVSAWGVSAGWFRGWGHEGRLGVDVAWEDGYGGQRLVADVGGMYAPLPRQLELDGRLTLVYLDSDLQEQLKTVSFGYQVGLRWLVGEGLTLVAMVEHNLNRHLVRQLRAFIVADLNVWVP